MVAEGRLFFELICEYSTDQMLDDLQRLYGWGREHGYTEKEFPNSKEMEKYAKEWVNQLYYGTPERVKEGDNLNKARRHVTHYFINIWDLYDGGYVKKSFVKRLCGVISTDVLKRNLYLEFAIRDKIGELDEQTADKVEDSKSELSHF